MEAEVSGDCLRGPRACVLAGQSVNETSLLCFQAEGMGEYDTIVVNVIYPVRQIGIGPNHLIMKGVTNVVCALDEDYETHQWREPGDYSLGALLFELVSGEQPRKVEYSQFGAPLALICKAGGETYFERAIRMVPA